MIKGSSFLTIAVIGLMSILVPAGAEGAIKPKDGLYYDSTSVKVPGSGYIQTTGGKIIGVGLNIKFKTSKGKACTPEGFFESSGYVNLAFSTKKTKPNRKNKFSVKNKFSPFNPGLKGTVTGKFKSRTKATFKAVLKADGCTARANYTKAVYTAGG